jgi:AbrB family looped-hinge helix DNA binding protein
VDGTPPLLAGELIGFFIRLMSIEERDVHMAAPEIIDETTVNDSHSVTVPAPIREQLDIEPGDKLRWTLTESGDLTVTVVSERYGAFEDFEPVDIGETNAVETESEFGAE